MGRLIKIVLLLGVWLMNLPAFAAAAPDLAVVQREKEIRLLFSWDQPVNFSENTRAGRYTLTFLTPAAVPAGRLRQISTALPRRWRQMTLTEKDGHLTFSVTLPKDSRAFAQKEGNDVFIVLSEKTSLPELRPVSDAPETEKKQETSENSSAEIPAVLTPPLISAKQKEVIDDADEQDESPEKIDLSAIPYTDSQTNISLSLSSPQIFANKDISSETEPLPDVSGYRAATLSFPWTRMTAVAAFRRDGYVWIVFDRKGEFDFSLERELYKDIIHEMIQVPHSHATIFRLVTQKGYNPSLRREGLLWAVDLMYQPIRPKQSVDLILQRKTPFGARIFVPLEESPQVIPLIDPEVGDLMYIVPIFSLGKGVPTPRSFVDANFLQTAQGMVIVPNIEELNVYSSTSGVEIRGPKGGMRFSSEDILSFLAKSKINTDPLSQILDVAAWSSNEPRDYLRDLKVLQNNVLNADKNNKDVQRLILAFKTLFCRMPIRITKMFSG